MALPTFSLQPGLLNLTSGVHQAESIIHCNEDGSISLNFNGIVENIEMKSGQDFAIYEADAVEINSGNFHMSNQ